MLRGDLNIWEHLPKLWSSLYLNQTPPKKVLISTAVVTVDNWHVFDKAAKKLETFVTIIKN